ncbi:uncharacterized protein TNCT_64621 [Trichonephila clavata]|uniref:Uncharacterized protein n=1 Tax=Trichonephila clavata TaxID=2740835 RepID=A0A8X6FT97_TRICU|nr:uncharacterized protein TNCT_64621 [Trichonephila clavata]
MTDEEKSKIRHQVQREAVVREAVINEIKIVKRWEDEWSFLAEKYKHLEEEIAKANVFTKCKEKEEGRGPVTFPKYPVTTAKEIGWLANDSRFRLEKFGQYARPIHSLHKEFEWPIEGCP